MLPTLIRRPMVGLGIFAVFQVALFAAPQNRRLFAKSPVPFPFWCQTTDDVQRKFYVTKVSQAPAGVSGDDLTRSFQAWMQAKYGYRGGAECGQDFVNRTTGKDVRLERIQQISVVQYTAVEIEFTFTPVPSPDGQAAAAVPPKPAKPAVDPDDIVPAAPTVAAPSAAPRPARERYAVCFGETQPSAPGGPRTLYASAPFVVPAGTPREWADQFKQTLQEKYSFKGGTSCQFAPTLSGAQEAIRRNIAQHYQSKSVETGWTYKE